jgi:hypothetical protein
VELGTEIDTDQWRGYSKNAMRGYRHEFHHPETQFALSSSAGADRRPLPGGRDADDIQIGR